MPVSLAALFLSRFALSQGFATLRQTFVRLSHDGSFAPAQGVKDEQGNLFRPEF